MPRNTPLVLTLALAACHFSQDFQVSASADGGEPKANVVPAAGDAGCGSDSDPNHCGACGHSCLGGACAAGACAPVVLASGQGDSVYGVPWYPYNTDAGDALDGPDRLAVDESHVYWLNLRGEVMRVPVSGGEASRVAKTGRGPGWIGLDDEHVYFSTLGAELYRVRKTGGTPVRLAPSMASVPTLTLFNGPRPFEFHVIDGQIYWDSGKGIYVCPVAGCPEAPRAVLAGTPEYRPFSFAIDASGQMYASVENHRATGPSTETGDYAMTLFRDGQWLGSSSSTAYYELYGGADEVFAISRTDFGSTGIVRWSQSSVTYLASGEGLSGIPRGLAVDDDYVYWSNAAPAVIDKRQRVASVVRCKKTGCASPEVLADGQPTPRAVGVSSDAVYWTTGSGDVMKLAKPPVGGEDPPK